MLVFKLKKIGIIDYKVEKYKLNGMQIYVKSMTLR